MHFEEVMRVELVVDEEGVAFGYCVDQWRFLWDFEGSDPDSADIQSLPDLVVVQADDAKGSADVEAELGQKYLSPRCFKEYAYRAQCWVKLLSSITLRGRIYCEVLVSSMPHRTILPVESMLRNSDFSILSRLTIENSLE